MTKQTNTCAPAAKPLGVWIDELKADRDEWKARAERAEGLLEAWVELAAHCSIEDGVCCCGEDMENHSNPMDCGHLPVDHGDYVARQLVEDTRAALTQTDAEPGLTLADAYRAGLEAAAKRHVYYAHQYERIGAIADAEAHMEHARQIRALPVPPEFGETNDQ